MNKDRAAEAGEWLVKNAVLAVILAIVGFWFLGLWNLERFPPVHEDEPWILSVGAKFIAQGTFGTDLFAGFYGMEQHYFLMLPLYPVLQGAATRLFGFSLFAVRFLSVAAGTLTLPLTYVVGRRLANRAVGLLAVLLLLVWQWAPAGEKFFGTGMPLIDGSRLARYDVATAPLGLLAFYFFLQARSTTLLRHDLLSGLFAGLTALTQVYGLLWILVLPFLLVIDRLFFSRRTIWLQAALVVAPGALLLLPWIAFILSNGQDFMGQTAVEGERFAIGDPNFYVSNVLNESSRYFLDLHNPATLLRAGFWVLVAGVPLMLLYLFWRAVRRKDRNAIWLLVPSLVFPFFMALLIETKNHLYLLGFAPLFGLAVAWVTFPLIQTRFRWPVLAGLLLLLAQGVTGAAQMEQIASRAAPADTFYTSLRQSLAASASVLGHPQYWLAGEDPQYRSFVLPFYMSDPQGNRSPVSFGQALARIAPRFVLIDPAIQTVFENRSTPYNREAGDQFADYMRAHGAHLVREIYDNYGTPIQVFELDQSNP